MSLLQVAPFERLQLSGKGTHLRYYIIRRLLHCFTNRSNCEKLLSLKKNSMFPFLYTKHRRILALSFNSTVPTSNSNLKDVRHINLYKIHLIYKISKLIKDQNPCHAVLRGHATFAGITADGKALFELVATNKVSGSYLLEKR